jgi:hypothetical protein
MDDNHGLTDEEYEIFLKVQDAYRQRAMGLGGGGNDIISKVIFNGENAEEFTSKFPHICMHYQVYQIFYEDYGRNRPGPDNQLRQTWDSLDSKAYRLLEKHLTDDIWSTLRDKPNMTARQIFDVLTATHLTGTVRSIATIELEMENTRMQDSDKLTSHFSKMCRYFRELECHNQPLTDRQKVTKTMCKMNRHWYEMANAWVITQPDDITFDIFRRRLLQMDIDSKSFDQSPGPQAAFAAASTVTNQPQQANFHHSVGGRGNRYHNNNRGRGIRGRSNGRNQQRPQQQQQQRQPQTCFYCGKEGHIARDCMKKDSESG